MFNRVESYKYSVQNITFYKAGRCTDPGLNYHNLAHFIFHIFYVAKQTAQPHCHQKHNPQRLAALGAQSPLHSQIKVKKKKTKPKPSEVTRLIACFSTIRYVIPPYSTFEALQT